MLFHREAAVVTDRGSPLSHAAIVAREHGIPAVVGTQTATSTITDGQAVLERLSDAPSCRAPTWPSTPSRSGGTWPPSTASWRSPARSSLTSVSSRLTRRVPGV